MIVKICDKCKSKEAINELRKLNIELEVNCINYCGVGRDKFVAIINNKPIISDNKKDFIDKIKEEI